ncbi:MAG: SufD family Fe-S cluster assembly protein, partial [Candidatus Micrarchaeota archaeon]
MSEKSGPGAMQISEGAIKVLSKSRGEPQWLLKIRLGAFGKFQALPLENSIAFRKYSDSGEVEWQKISLHGWKAQTGDKIPKSLEPAINSLGAGVLQLNGQTAKSSLRKESGVEVMDWQTAVNDDESGAKAAIEKAAAMAESKIANLAVAAFTGGFFVRVLKEAKIMEPIRIAAAATAPRAASGELNTIDVGANASASVMIERHSQIRGGAAAASAAYTAATVGEGARLGIAQTQAHCPQMASLSETKTILAQNSRLESASGHFCGGLSIALNGAWLEGDGSSAQDSQMASACGRSRLRVSSDLFHVGRNTSGKVTSRGVFFGSSKGLFTGMIGIAPAAAGTTSYLSGHSLILSRQASAAAIPALKIENNEVRATHSAAVSPIDENALFYLQARGISPHKAIEMAACGFLAPAAMQCPTPQAGLRMRALALLRMREMPVLRMA